MADKDNLLNHDNPLVAAAVLTPLVLPPRPSAVRMELRPLLEVGAAVVLEFCPAIADMIELIRACWLVCAACPGDAEAPAAAAVWAGTGVAEAGNVNGVDAAADAVGAAAGVVVGGTVVTGEGLAGF